MKNFDKRIQQFKNFTGDLRICITGEVIVSCKDNTQLFVPDKNDCQNIDKSINLLRSHYYFLKVEKKENVVEISIKFFSYKTFIADKNFLENLRTSITEIINIIGSNDTLSVRVNASGIIENKSVIQSFIVLSKGSYVEYKITKSAKQTILNPIIINKVLVYGISSVFIVLIGMVLYTLCVHIPDHDPNKLLTKLKIFE